MRGPDELPRAGGNAGELTPGQLLDSPDFRRLVFRRWRISLVLTACLFVLYYGYILLIALDKAFLSRRIDGATTMGIPIGAAVIAGAWILTAVYVVWANRHYDGEVTRLRGQLRR
jgi:uncharacterized membrane protein (DUF485 family)